MLNFSKFLPCCVVLYVALLSRIGAAWGQVASVPENAGALHLVAQLGHIDRVNSVAISPNGRQVLTGGNDNVVRLWDVATGQELRCFVGHTFHCKNEQFFL
jgi:WD40 repeat protein